MNTISILKALLEEGEQLAPLGGNLYYNGDKQSDYVSWRLQVITTIEELGQPGKVLLKDLESDGRGPYFFASSASRVLGVLKSAIAIAERKSLETPKLARSQRDLEIPSKVFIVHGHAQVLLQQVARFLERIDIEAVVLFEQPGRGRTIIEKLEESSSVSFAVVLLTPDDLGRAGIQDSAEMRPRARQNVVFELGYFVGKLGREAVSVLYDESVELPSDYHGVEYIKVDAEGAWRLKLGRELKQFGFSVDMNKAL